jgi:hypothetical protein
LFQDPTAPAQSNQSASTLHASSPEVRHSPLLKPDQDSHPADKVVTLFNQGHIAGSLDHKTLATGLGGALDGTLRQHAVFDEAGQSLPSPQRISSKY